MRPIEKDRPSSSSEVEGLLMDTHIARVRT